MSCSWPAAGCSIDIGVSAPGTVLGGGQGVMCCLCGSPGQATRRPGLLLVLAELT